MAIEVTPYENQYGWSVTSALDKEIKEVIAEVNGNYPGFGLTYEAVLDKCEVFAENGLSDGVFSAEQQISDSECWRLDYLRYIDPFIRKDALAASGETVVGLVESVTDPELIELLATSNFPAHLVCEHVDHEGLPVFQGLYSDGRGLVVTESFENMKEACAFSLGMSKAEIHEALANSYGSINSETGVVYPTHGSPSFGLFYKDALLFEMCKRGFSSSLPCYIGECVFEYEAEPLENIEGEIEGYILEDWSEFGYQGVLRECGAHEKVADRLFYEADGYAISTHFVELDLMGDNELPAAILGVHPDEYTFLDYVRDDSFDRPVYVVVGEEVCNDKGRVANVYVKDVAGCAGAAPDLHWSEPKIDIDGEVGSRFENLSARYDPSIVLPVIFFSSANLELPDNARLYNELVLMAEKGVSGLSKSALEGVIDVSAASGKLVQDITTNETNFDDR